MGDIHGSYDRLERVLQELVPSLPPATRLVFLGDYIDRGPDSRQVLESLIRLKSERPDTVFLLGNHERMLLEVREGRDLLLWSVNGGSQTMASYGLSFRRIKDIPAEHIDFLSSLTLYHQSGDYIFVHAGLRPGVLLAQQEERDLLWIRESFFLAEPTWEGTVVFGHTPFSTPFQRPGLIGIDTGAVYNNVLTCLKLPERKFHHF